MSKLTARQERFCREYIIDLNGTQAAIRAGYSEKGAEVQASQLLRNIKVKHRVNELQGKVEKKLEITAEFILGELYKLATVDLSKAYDENGNLKQIHDIPEEVRKAISGVETYYERAGTDEEGNPDRCTVKRLKFWDKTKALDMLARHKNLFKDEKESESKEIRVILEDYRVPEKK